MSSARVEVLTADEMESQMRDEPHVAAVPPPASIAADLGETPKVFRARGIREPVNAERIADGINGSVAARLRAKFKASRLGTREFPVPGFDGGLLLVAQSYPDQAEYQQGVSLEVFIAKSTKSLVLVDDDGTRTEIPAWGKELAEMIGVECGSTSELVSLVFETPPKLDAFGTALLLWQEGRLAAVEAELGE